MQGVYGNIAEYNIDEKCKTLIVLDDMVSDLIGKEKLNQIVTELFIKGRKLNVFVSFIT